MSRADMHVPTPGEVRRAFDRPASLTVGVEEEVVLLDARTLDLLPRGMDVVARCGDPAVKPEMPASQIELLTTPVATVGEATAQMQTARRHLQQAAAGVGVLAGMAVHPFSDPLGALNTGPRYTPVLREYAWVARRQLVAGLQVHVAIGPVERAIAVHNALRDHLPELAALAAAAPFHGGVDTGLASVRPKIAENLPRQGVPPPVADVDDLVGAWRWAVTAGAMQHVGQWWWELRLHPAFGTLEVRVCDAQATVARSAALLALIQSLCGWLLERAEAGDLAPPAATWRIEANRWSACRHGTAGQMADLRTGRPVPTADRVAALVAQLEPVAVRLGCADQLALIGGMLADPSPVQQRRVAAQVGLPGLCAWLAGQFTADAVPRESAGGRLAAAPSTPHGRAQRGTTSSPPKEQPPRNLSGTRDRVGRAHAEESRPQRSGAEGESRTPPR